MKTWNRIACNAMLAASATLAAAWPAQAALFTTGNQTPSTEFFVQGQSFTPGVQGNAGTGAAPLSGTVLLDSFTIDYATGVAPLANLYIYASLPSLADAATGVGSLATGVHIGGGVYDFTDIPLDVSTLYYAVLPEATGIFDGDGDLYGGGIDLFDRPPEDGQLDQGFGAFDIGFQAVFNAVPISGTLALALMAFAGLASTRRRHG